MCCSDEPTSRPGSAHVLNLVGHLHFVYGRSVTGVSELRNWFGTENIFHAENIEKDCVAPTPVCNAVQDTAALPVSVGAF